MSLINPDAIDYTKPEQGQPKSSQLRAVHFAIRNQFVIVKSEIHYLSGYDLPFSFEGSPGAGVRIAAIVILRAVHIPPDMVGSIFRVTGLNAQYVLTVQLVRSGNPIAVGTVTLEADGTSVIDTPDMAATAGDEIWVLAPDIPNPSITSVRGAILGRAVFNGE